MSSTSSSPLSSPITSSANSLQSSPAGTPPLSSVMDGANEKQNLAKKLSAPAWVALQNLQEFSAQTINFKKEVDKKIVAALEEINPKIYETQQALSDEELESVLQSCPALTTLNLYGFHQITNVALRSIVQLENLSTLKLGHTRIRDLTALSDRPLKHLTHVNFHNTPISFSSLITFLQNHSIQHLTLPHNPPERFLAAIPYAHLKDLRISIDSFGEGNMTFEELAYLFKTATQLQKVKVYVRVKELAIDFTVFNDVQMKTKRELKIKCTKNTERPKSYIIRG